MSQGHVHGPCPGCGAPCATGEFVTQVTQASRARSRVPWPLIGGVVAPEGVDHPWRVGRGDGRLGELTLALLA